MNQLVEPVALHALSIANAALQLYMISDLYIKYLSYDELYSAIKNLIYIEDKDEDKSIDRLQN